MHRAQAVSAAVGVLCLMSRLLFLTPQLMALFPVSCCCGGKRTWQQEPWRMNCSVFRITTLREVVPWTRIPLWGCVTAASTNTPLPKGLGECVANVERFPSLPEGLKDRNLLLPSTLKDKTAAYPSCLRTGYSSAVSIAGNGCAETAGFS